MAEQGLPCNDMLHTAVMRMVISPHTLKHIFYNRVNAVKENKIIKHNYWTYRYLPCFLNQIYVGPMLEEEFYLYNL